MSQQLETQEALQQIWEKQPRHFLNRKCYTTKSLLEGRDIQDTDVPGLLARVQENRFLQFWKKYSLVGSDAGALGEVSSVVVEAAQPKLFAREMCWVQETTGVKVRFPLAVKAKATRRIVGSTPAPAPVIPERMTFTDVEPDTEILGHAKFEDSFLEDASWPAVERNVREQARAVGEDEADFIIKDLFENIANADLASGAQTVLADPMTAANLTDMITDVREADFDPKAAFMRPKEFGELKKDANFLDSLKWGEALDKARGEMARTIDGVRIFTSTKIPTGKVYIVDTDWACGFVVRRDLVTEPYDKRDELSSGIVVSSRVGGKILRTKATQRGA